MSKNMAGFFLVLGLAGFGVAPLSAAPSTAASMARLDTLQVRKLYMNGDFDVGIEILEKVLAQKRALNHQDSVFIFKHLGVMHAAKEETREKGKYYMYQLLLVEPTARIMDMYASDMIYMIFRNIQEEFATTRTQLTDLHGQGDEGNTHQPSHIQNPNPSGQGKSDGTGGGSQAKQGARRGLQPSHGHALAWWLGGLGVAAGIGTGFYLYSMQQDGAPPEKNTKVTVE